MPVMEHLRELRRRVIISLIIISLGAIIGWVFYDSIIHFLKEPYCAVPAEHRREGKDGQCTLAFFAPLDGFTTRLKVSFIAGTVITGPLWLYQIWAFVTPGLRKNERKWTVVFVIASSTLFLTGMALAYAILYKGMQVIIGSAGSGTQAELSITSYLGFITLMMLVFGASFELPLLIIMLNITRILPYKILKRFQRIGIFGVFVFAGVATPTTDPFTMCAFAIPMVLLFEGAVFFAFIHDRRLAQRKAAEAEALADDEASTIDPIPERIDGDSWSSLP